jgi:mono/diheme cytochrome c family protein
MRAWYAIAVAALVAATASTAVLGSDAELASKGRSTYHLYCALCHGPNLVNRSSKTFDLRKFPYDEAERFRTSVKKGKGQMPPWGDRLSDADINAIWAYVKTGGKQ